MVVTRPGTLTTTTLLDAQLRHLPQAGRALKHNSTVKFFTGASEVMGTVRLLDRDELAPGDNGWVQLVLSEPVVVVKGDHFILRRPSPSETIGGGVVANPHPGRRHRRHSAEVLARLETQRSGSPEALLLEALDRLGPVSCWPRHWPRRGETMTTGKKCWPSMTRGGDLIEVDGQNLVMSHNGWAVFESQLLGILAAYHAAHPLRSGMPREELKNRLGQLVGGQRWASWNARVFNALLAKAAADGVVMAVGSTVRRTNHQVRFTIARTGANHRAAG